MVRFRVHAPLVPVRREGQDVRRLVVGHVDAESGGHEQGAVLLLQEIGFRLQLAADAAPFEHRHLIIFLLYFCYIIRFLTFIRSILIKISHLLPLS